MNYAIQTDTLSKNFGEVCAVQSVTLQVKRSEIYGFLGLNGAGKTTTIRALLGMIRPSAGTVEVLGQPVGPHGRGPWRRIGHLVEKPVAYPELTVRENLEIARRLQKISDRRATFRAIDRLRLASYVDRKAGTLSTGNLLRLGLARALLHEPELLILDEPTSGLDPAGVVEVRELLRGLAREKGVTVFMSSHILTEVGHLATRIGVIHNGRLIEELDAEKLKSLRPLRLEIRARNLEYAQSVLTKAGYQVITGEDRLFISDEKAIRAPEEVATILVNAGTPPTRLVVEQENLEEYFLRLTGANG